LMDGDLSTNAHDCGRGNDNRCDVFGHGWCEVGGFDPPASRLVLSAADSNAHRLVLDNLGITMSA
jgi:hypothetical protein